MTERDADLDLSAVDHPDGGPDDTEGEVIESEHEDADLEGDPITDEEAVDVGWDFEMDESDPPDLEGDEPE